MSPTDRCVCGGERQYCGKYFVAAEGFDWAGMWRDLGYEDEATDDTNEGS